MQLCVKRIDISTGDSAIVLLTKRAAITHDLHTGDRVMVMYNNKQVIAAVDTTHGGFGLHDDQVGLFSETADTLGVDEACGITIVPAPKPASIPIIKKKMQGKELDHDEIKLLVQDIVDHRLTQVELTYFVAAASMFPLTFAEITSLTKAMAETGDRLHFDRDIVIDKHCIGGVPNNRTTMITVPIMAALGFTVPKTSSRAITSPAGTADTMEVLANVDLPIDKMRQVVLTTGGCMVWGGGVNLAPADDRIIRIERPLSIDVPGLMISSVMAKKYSVSPTHVLIDIPYGKSAKVATKEEAEALRKQFQTIGKLLGMKVLVIITDGSQPIGNGIGPLLEAYDVLAVLKNDAAAPADLREKAIMIAGELLEFIGHCPKGEGRILAQATLANGKADKKFQEIIDAQGRHVLPPLARYTHHVVAPQSGTVTAIDNISICRVARVAGAPISKNAGVLLYAKRNAVVKQGEQLYTIYADSEDKLQNAKDLAQKNNAYTIS